MPVPPPWWIDTHVAPAAVLTRALSSGQSAIASEPSRMPFGLAVGRRHRTCVEVVAADDDRRADLARGDQLVEAQAGLGALAVAQPADARRQALERHALLRHRDPACAATRSRGTARGSPRRCAGCPPDRPRARPSGTAPCPSQKSGRMKAGTKPGKSKAFVDAGGLRLGADVVAVVEGDRARLAADRASRAPDRPSNPSLAST